MTKVPVDEKKLAVERVRECIEIANKHYSRDFPQIETKFDLTGRVGGYFWRKPIPGTKTSLYWFRLNRDLLKPNIDEYLKQIIPHEVSHYVALSIWGSKIKAHGKEWKSVMVECFGIAPDRCHDMDTSVSSSRPYIHSCGCKEFSLSKRMHISILRGSIRRCKACKGTLVFVRDEVVEKVVPVIKSLFVSTAGAPLKSAHIERIRAAVATNQVIQIVSDSLTNRAGGLRALARALSLPLDRVSVHPNDNTLPANVTHAILFFEQDFDRQTRVARAFESQGVVLRRLKHDTG